MRFRRLLATALAAVVGGTLAVIALPQPASADPPVYLQLLWIRCQDDTGEWGDDEILLEIGGNIWNPGSPAAIRNGIKVGPTYWIAPQFPPYNPTPEITGDSVTVWVYERDDPSNRVSWDVQGSFSVNRNEVNTGEHEAYAFDDGQFIIRYKVIYG